MASNTVPKIYEGHDVRHALISALAMIGVHEHLSAEQKHDLVQAGMQVTPGAAAATGAHAMGWQMSDLLALVSILFVLAQLAYLVWKWRRDSRREDERIEDRRLGVRIPVCDADPSDE